MESQTPSTNSRSSITTVKLDWRIVSATLAFTIIGMLWLWQPWRATSSRTISVRGEATVSQVPDSYTFSPIYSGADIKTVTAKGNDVVSHLKSLGVKDAQIKTSVLAAQSIPPEQPIPMGVNQSSGSGTSQPLIYPYPNSSPTYAITVDVTSKSLTQSIADYLATTSATGIITPTAQLSKAAVSDLNLKARSSASDDAIAKARVMAKQLGAGVGRVVSVTEDNTGVTDPTPLGFASPKTVQSSTDAGPTIEPGTEEVSYGVAVVFELK